jgi:hypothetical protein
MQVVGVEAGPRWSYDTTMQVCKHCGEKLAGWSRCWRCGYENKPALRESDESPEPAQKAATPQVVAGMTVACEASASMAPPRLARYPRHPAAVGGAIAAALLGLLGLLVAALTPIPVAGMFLGILGLLLGLWGLLSRRRALALAGLILCCLAIFLGGFRSLVQLYTRLHGTSPFETSIEKPLTPEQWDQFQGG